MKCQKLLAKINSKPVIAHSLYGLSSHPLVKEIIVVVNPLNCRSVKETIKQYRIKKIMAIVLGGKRRQDSVVCGLSALSPKAKIVLIHDGARPFVDQAGITKLINEAASHGAAIFGVPVKATIKEGTGVSGHQGIRVKRTIERDNLWEIQTPQAFKKDLIVRAYRRFSKLNVTDDAMLVEKMGIKVNLVLGSYNNIKITTPEDLVIAKAIAKKLRAKR